MVPTTPICRCGGSWPPTAGPLLDLGSGTGRVAVDLAAQGYGVVALDSEAELLAELSQWMPRWPPCTPTPACSGSTPSSG